jgi:predicted AlkP superfamily pyrophosphatase or phosphodiesterase
MDKPRGLTPSCGMQRTVVLNVVGLTERCLGEATPHLNAFRRAGAFTRIRPAFPAVTCTAQSNYLTGEPPARHGIVANGWYDRALAEVQFWKQSNHLVQAPKLWETLRTRIPGFTVAKLFWWFNMYSGADWSITPRPMYPADGRKVFDIYAWPYEIRPAIKADLGEFPFPTFWGPAAGVPSPAGAPDAASRWIAESAKWIERRHRPTLSLVYLPHLDYGFQRHGPDAPDAATDLRRIDAIVGDLLDFFRERGVAVVLLSEYGLTPVNRAVHLNRVFRGQGWLTVKEELGRELLDCGACRAFAVADHQVAHIYVNEPGLLDAVREAGTAQPGVARVLGAEELKQQGLEHPRSGDLVAVAEEDAWFSYYYWEGGGKRAEDGGQRSEIRSPKSEGNHDRAPDFARTVDIHRKPGFDPVELFTRPDWSSLRLKAHIAWRLLQKRLGFRMLMDVIPLDATLVRGSHGGTPKDPRDWPVLMSGQADRLTTVESLDSTDVAAVLMGQVIGAV